MRFEYYAKLGTTKLINPPSDNFRITEILDGIATFEYTIQNTSANRTTITAGITDDFTICRLSDDLVLLTGSIDSDSIRYYSENATSPDRISFSGYASYIDMAYLIFKRLATADASAVGKVYDLDDSASAYTDYTTEANEATADDVLLTFGALDDTLLIGQDETFSVVKIKYSTKGIQAANTIIAYEYYNGAAQVALDALDAITYIDESRGFTEDVGTYYIILAGKPSDWTKSTENGVEKYWLYIRISTGSYSTLPKLDQIWTGDTDICRVQFDNIAADTILSYVLENTEYTEDATDQCPSTQKPMRMEYESRLRSVFGIARALTWDDGGDKKPYDCWITSSDKKVHFAQKRSDPKQDYTTFTEVDPNTHLALVNTDHIDFDAHGNEDCYLYKDFGADYFDNFEFKVDAKVLNMLASSKRGHFFALTNDIDDMKGLENANKTHITLFFYNAGGNIRLYMEEWNSNNPYTDFYTILQNTWYYFTITKSGTSLTCKIYSDSARTTLLDTLSLTLHGDHTFRHLFGANTYNSSTAQFCTLDIENLIFRRDFSSYLTMLDKSEGYAGLVNRYYGLGSFDGINQKRAIVENQDSQDTYGLREIPYKDMRYSYASTLKEAIQKQLTDSKEPLKDVSCEVLTTYWLDKSLAVGDEVVVDQPNWNVTAQPYRIMQAVINPDKVTLDLGIHQPHLENIRSRLQDQININDVWMHGSNNVYQESSEVFVDESVPGLQRFYISAQMEKINRAYLRYKAIDYEGAAWTKNSDMAVLPDAEASSPWTKVGTHSTSVSGGILHLTDNTDVGCIMYYHSWVVDRTTGYNVKARLKVVSSSNDAGSIVIDSMVGYYYWSLSFYDDRIVLLPIDEYGHTIEYIMDTTTDYNIYLIVVKNDNIKIYVNGILRINARYMSNSAVSGNVIRFGCGVSVLGCSDSTQGETYIDYIKYSENGIIDVDDISLKCEIGEEGGALTEVDGSPTSLEQTKIDITSAVRALGKNAWFVIQYTPGQSNCRVFSSIFCEAFLYSK